MKVINLWGGPGVGKSSTAAGLFQLMKLDGCNVELVTEYAKQLVWAEGWKTLKDQLYIVAKQNHRLEILRDNVDYVITDSPLPLSLLYAVPGYPESFAPLVLDMFNRYDNMNFVLRREKPYQSAGRYQDESQAMCLDTQMLTLLDDVALIEYMYIRGHATAAQQIYAIIKEKAYETHRVLPLV